MEDRSAAAGFDATALVVRQFTPSRLERQLLTQVFELVCNPRESSIGDDSGPFSNSLFEPQRIVTIERNFRRRGA